MLRRMLNTILDNWPLKRQLGFYAYLPAFFLLGACNELIMIHLNINNVNFYSTYTRKEFNNLIAEREKLDRLLDEKRKELQLQLTNNNNNKSDDDKKKMK